ncbi:HNH endonuclease [Aquirufa nivalisilvae]|uniref:HNH endonuclease n=1 Tax=Aquirufa nivalisilvae TaxID=2516557 RepID=UPI0022A9C771|nr:HNH endonuclease signature motif containing protein [Aquirufa nivalisilvae]MCZ2481284.1 DUF3427 domain-containing protein [Aquirufa nivalisilvae]
MEISYSIPELGELYSKKSLSLIFQDPSIESVREGIFHTKNSNSMLLFVDLVKTGKESRFHFNDYFEGDYFHWDSQTTQHINSPRIQKIVKKEVDVLLFCRIQSKIKSESQPFVYCGKLEYLEHNENTSKPVHLVFQSLDFDETISIPRLKEIYNWTPEKNGGITTNNYYSVKKIQSRNRGEQKRPNYTERKGLVTSRVGQGWYRQEILKKWGNKCAITGCEVVEILISSHIKRWSESNEDERLDPDNGILLTPHLDSLFDKHLISFKDDGQIIISKRILKSDLNILGISDSIKLKVDEGMRKYLKTHRINFTQKESLLNLS